MNAVIEQLVKKAIKTEHGFKEIEKTAEVIAQTHSLTDAIRLAKELCKSEVYQARMLATFIFGLVSAKSDKALGILRKQVSQDENWRVQEILAKAFDRYCADIGYEKALPVIKSWLKDKNPNARRAVSEGLRIWTGRDYFKEHPEVAVSLLAGLKADESEYVRTSSGNALRDISKKHPALIKKELAGWDLTSKRLGHTYRLAGKLMR